MKLTNINKPFLALVALVAIVGAYAQSGGHSQHQRKAQAGAGMSMPMAHMDMAKCMADMKAGAAKLKSLAATMNASKGADKTDATSAVVNELLAQQAKCDAMCMEMMSHMGDMKKTTRPKANHSKHHES